MWSFCTGTVFCPAPVIQLIFKRLATLTGSRSYRSTSSSGDFTSKQVSTGTRKMVITSCKTTFPWLLPLSQHLCRATPRHGSTTASTAGRRFKEAWDLRHIPEGSEIAVPYHNAKHIKDIAMKRWQTKTNFSAKWERPISAITNCHSLGRSLGSP